MQGKSIALFGIYGSDAQAEPAAVNLMEFGHTSDDISFLLRDRLPEATRGGAVEFTGGKIGFLAGIGVLPVPRLGPYFAAGPVRMALTSATGLADALARMGIPEFEARRYEGKIQAGGILLSVDCHSPVSITHAQDLLKRTGAQDIAFAGDASASPGRSYNRPVARV